MARDEDEQELGPVKQFLADHPKVKHLAWAVPSGIVAILVIVGSVGANSGPSEEELAQQAELQAAADRANNSNKPSDEPEGINGGTNSDLALLQKNLEKRYGKAPSGFVWNDDGTLLSLGIKGMESDDAVYTFLRSISTLDMGTAEQMSRKSQVVKSYGEYYDKLNNREKGDYSSVYEKAAYRAAMQSLQVEGLKDTSVFAEDRRVYTVDARIVDLTDKDFWVKDKETIFNNIWKYREDHNDKVKAEQYLTEYLTRHYESGNAAMQDVTFGLTVQRYTDLNTGWLVSIDQELDDRIRYSQGVSTYDFIMEEYRKWADEKKGF